MTVIMLSIIATVALVGVVVAVTPFIMPPTECFTVTVPPSAKQDPRVRALLRTHTIIVAVLTVIGMVAMASLLPQADDVSATAVMAFSTLAPALASFAFMLYARTQVQALKQAEGWTAAESRSAAFVSDDSIPQPIPLAWELLHVVVVAALAGFALLAYDRLPDQIPMHAGWDGTVNSYADKTLGTVMFPALIAAFMGLTLALAHWMILRSKRPIDPAAPATSALAYGEFARAQSIGLLAGGLVLDVTIGIPFFLSSAGIISLGAAGAVTTVGALVFAGVMVGISVKYGQSGGRSAAEMRTADGIARDDDAFWKLGVFYFNPDDPSFSVPKRFGSGWTINCANPKAWLVIGALVAASVVFGAISLKIAG